MTDTRVEYRAQVRGPASFLASPDDRKRGYYEYWTPSGKSQDDVYEDSYDLRRSVETHCWVHRWQKRTVILGEWEDV